VSGQQHSPAVLYPRERPGTHCTGGWVGLEHRAVEKTKRASVLSIALLEIVKGYTWNTQES